MISLQEGAASPAPRPRSGQVVVLRLEVAGSRPAVWRRIAVRDSLSLSRLHDSIQVAFDWFDYQTHVYLWRNRRLGNPVVGDEAVQVEDDRDVRLADLTPTVGDRALYQYRFGEGWTVEIVIEEIRPLAKGERLPVCLAGERAGPPEDCGGLEAFHDMLACLQEPTTELGREWREWVGPEYDPQLCDPAAITRGLRRLPK